MITPAIAATLLDFFGFVVGVNGVVEVVDEDLIVEEAYRIIVVSAKGSISLSLVLQRPLTVGFAYAVVVCIPATD